MQAHGRLPEVVVIEARRLGRTWEAGFRAQSEQVPTVGRWHRLAALAEVRAQRVTWGSQEGDGGKDPRRKLVLAAGDRKPVIKLDLSGAKFGSVVLREIKIKILSSDNGKKC